jgi:hypothetical protein
MLKLIPKIFKDRYKFILKELKDNTEYIILAICFSVFSLYLISFTLPLAKANINEYMGNARTLVLALGAGFFGLLGFIVGGFAITSGKMTDLLKNQVNKRDEDDTLEDKSSSLKLMLSINIMYHNILIAYRNSVRIIIFNIIASFICFIITLIPKEFNEILFWLCISVIVISFYLAIFYTLNLFRLGMKPLLIDLIDNEFEIRGLINDYETEKEWENFHPELKKLLKKKNRNNTQTS